MANRFMASVNCLFLYCLAYSSTLVTKALTRIRVGLEGS